MRPAAPTKSLVAPLSATASGPRTSVTLITKRYRIEAHHVWTHTVSRSSNATQSYSREVTSNRAGEAPTMGLFGKRRPEIPPKKTPIGPIDDDQLVRASEIMEELDRSDFILEQIMWSVLRHLGMNDRRAYFAHMGMNMQDVDIGWRWLLAVSLEATKRGEVEFQVEGADDTIAMRGDKAIYAHDLICRIWAFTAQFNTIPKNELPDLVLAPAEIEARLADLALSYLSMRYGRDWSEPVYGTTPAYSFYTYAAKKIIEYCDSCPDGQPAWLTSYHYDKAKGLVDLLRP